MSKVHTSKRWNRFAIRNEEWLSGSTGYYTWKFPQWEFWVPR